jgi:hypothetical protein
MRVYHFLSAYGLIAGWPWQVGFYVFRRMDTATGMIAKVGKERGYTRTGVDRIIGLKLCHM